MVLFVSRNCVNISAIGTVHKPKIKEVELKVLSVIRLQPNVFQYCPLKVEAIRRAAQWPTIVGNDLNIFCHTERLTIRYKDLIIMMRNYSIQWTIMGKTQKGENMIGENNFNAVSLDGPCWLHEPTAPRVCLIYPSAPQMAERSPTSSLARTTLWVTMICHWY